MKIELHQIKLSDVTNGYKDSALDGVVAYGGKLDVRPAYQREFVYDEKKRNGVVNTIVKGFPLNVMYWVKNEHGDGYEMLDGQQRTISFCQYVNGDYSINERGFNNLTKTEQDQILNYELMIYICEGNDKEKLDWFKIINIAGEVLTPQELRNAIYTGEWLTDAKRHFSKPGCAAVKIGDKLLNGSPIRQAYLETSLKWIADKEGTSIEGYMSSHQHEGSAAALWLYYQNVISWVDTLFPKKTKEMKGIDWGLLYNKYSAESYNPTELAKQVDELYGDRDVSNKKGIYLYVLGEPEKVLSIRSFEEEDRLAVYAKQSGVCPMCKKHFEYEEMQGDHVVPWSKGGKTTIDNLQMLCNTCNLTKKATEADFRRFN